MARINFLVSTENHRQRALNQLATFSWAILITSFLLVLALPVLAGGITILLFERNFNARYFDAKRGDPVLFQQLF
jgi:heme/copper-type cytochrome/quinol oxidase subunit 1